MRRIVTFVILLLALMTLYAGPAFAAVLNMR